MPFITQGKTNIKYILIIVILTSIVGGGILAYQYWWLPKQEIKSPEIKLPEKVKDGTADWKTYRNEEYGYEIKYPDNFQLKNQYGETFLSSEESPKIYIFAGKNLSAASLECGGRCQYPKSEVASSEKDGDWNKDYIFEYGGMGGWDTVVNAHQQKDGNYYILSLYASKQLGTPGIQGGGKPTYAELIAPELKNLQDKNNKDIIIFNKILSTFRFINIDETANWKTYKNEEYGFEIKYPDVGWELHPASWCIEPRCIWFMSKIISEGCIVDCFTDSFNVQVKDRDGATYQDLVSGYTINKIKNITVGGIETEIFEDPDTMGVGSTRVLFLIKDNLVYKITGGLMTSSFSQEKFDQVLSTFRFSE